MKALLIFAFIMSQGLTACSSPQTKTERKGDAENVKSTIESETKNTPTMKTITFPSTDGLEMTADYYENPEASKLLILCHQAGYSRGEYIQTALEFVNMGYACLALDQRSGNEVNGVVNETAKRAKSQNLPTKYADAMPDLEAALPYSQNELGFNDIMMIGSSYSSSLVILMAAKYGNDIAAVASFSPGNYFKIDGLDVSDYALKVDIPVFITSAKSEKKSWQAIYDNLASPDKVEFLPQVKGFHGSKALWKGNEGRDSYWKALTGFLSEHFPA